MTINFPRNLPTNVRRFAWLWIFSEALLLVSPFLIPMPQEWVSLGITKFEFLAIEFSSLIVAYAVNIVLFWLTVWRAANWARWVLLLLFVVPLAIGFTDLDSFRGDRLPLSLFSLAVSVPEAIGFFVLFTGDARAWFRRGNSGIAQRT